MKRKKESWNALTSEFGGSGRLQKRKEVKKEKWKGMCVEEKKQREKKEKKKKKKCGMCVKDKKRGEKKGKKRKKKMVSQYFHNTFTINFKW